jgi:hypothetical protein
VIGQIPPTSSIRTIVPAVPAAETYCRDISRELRYLATWPPGAPVAVGRVGRFVSGKVFDPETSLQSYGVDFGVEVQDSGQRSMSYTSKGVNEFGISVGANVPDPFTGVVSVGAQTTITFAREHEVVFFASGLRHRRMEDQPRIARAVLTLLKRDEWQRDWHIVTEVIEVDSISVLLSNAGSATAELALSADAQGAGVDLLHAQFKPRLVRRHAMHTTLVNEGVSAPLFRAKRVKRSVLGRAKLSAGFRTADDVSLEELSEVELAQELFDEVDVVDTIATDDG